jgi:hypothetical protein
VKQQSRINNHQSKILFQYWRRVIVLVACAGTPAFFNLATARFAASRVRNRP